MGGGNIYSGSIEPGQVNRTMISKLAARLFSGSLTDVACHLLDGRLVFREELSELRKLIRVKKTNSTADREVGDCNLQHSRPPDSARK